MLIEPREALARTSTFTLAGAERMNLTTTYQGRSSPLHTYAIYGVEGKILTYCVAAPDHERPTTFTTSRGDGRTLVVLKRTSAIENLR